MNTGSKDPTTPPGTIPTGVLDYRHTTWMNTAGRAPWSRRTLADLANPAPEGQRHGQMVRLAMDLLRAGIVAEAVFVQLRAQYDEGMPDDEIRKVIDWAGTRCHQPARSDSAVSRCGESSGDPASSVERVAAWLKGLHVSEADFFEVSPWRPPGDFQQDGAMLLAGLYGADDHINIVTEHEVVPGDPHKARPRGAGKTLRRDDWLREFREKGSPESAAGGWVRLNPVRASGGGQGGAFTDGDTTAHRFLLVESDILPPEQQLAVLAALPLPVAAIIASGGRSYHAWIRVDAADEESYRGIGRRIFKTLTPFGFDPQNANPSRLLRLPGVRRQIGADGDGQQRLIYLNPDANGNRPIFERK